jgi:hypothetical protein
MEPHARSLSSVKGPFNMDMLVVVNKVMLGCKSEPGEPDWDSHDVWDIPFFEALVEMDIWTYAERSPHMILMLVDESEV